MIAKLRSWWKKRVKPLEITGLILLLIGLLALLISIIVLGYIFNWNWTGLGTYTPPHPYESSFQRGKTLWDWLQLLIIPAVIAGAGYLINLTTTRNEQKSTQLRDQTEREIASDNQREAALQQYIDKMSELLLDKELRKSQTQDDEVRKIARVRTLTVLPRLDAVRKSSVLQFLYESGLLEKDKAIIDLNDSDLSGACLSQAILIGATLNGANLGQADLGGAFLIEANLSGVNLNQANLYGTLLIETYLSGADLSEANLSKANLGEADLSKAILSGANLSEANLSKAILSGADLSEANLSGANLSKAIMHGTILNGADLGGANFGGTQVTFEQLDKAKSLSHVTMPNGSIHP